jgi:NADH dehydrogenase
VSNRKGVSKRKVLIVGGGFAGLYVARGLRAAPVEITLVDKHNYHLFRPMLYQAATGLLSADEIAAPIRSVLRNQRNVDVLMAEVVGVDVQANRVLVEDGSLPYDDLVLATGIQYNYFGNASWPAIAPGLDSIDEADRIRGKIFAAFEAAERLVATGRANDRVLRELLTFVQVGAGTAGVEMAGTIAELVRMTLTKDFRHIEPRSAHILLLEAGPRILSTYPEALATRACDHLRRLGVDVRTKAKVEQVDERGVVVNGERIESQTVLWSAGVVASPAGRWLAAEVDRSGRVLVQADLSVPNHPNIFVVGDTAALTAHRRNLVGVRSKAPTPLPGVAQVAIQEGKYVASLLRRRVAGKPSPPPFWYWDKGELAIVGRTYAVANLKPLRITGLLAWALWAGVHIFFLIGFANRLLVALQWAISFFTKRHGVRIFPGSQEASARKLGL